MNNKSDTVGIHTRIGIGKVKPAGRVGEALAQVRAPVEAEYKNNKKST